MTTARRVAVVSSAQTVLRDAWDDLQHVDLIGKAVGDALRGTGLEIRGEPLRMRAPLPSCRARHQRDLAVELSHLCLPESR